MKATNKFFRSIALTDVTLRVRDLTAELDFYRELLGFRIIDETPERVGLSPTGEPPALIVLESAPAAPRRAPGAAGLFHLAILYPDRPALGRVARRLAERGVPFGGGDHGVSEALYLDDPEGNSVELYADRPPAAWPTAKNDDQVAMVTEAVDVPGLIAAGDGVPGPLLPAATRIGHLHLSVSNLERARDFYSDTLGFAVRQRDYPGALFFGRDGYHHHFGANIWRSRQPALPGVLGLVRFTIRFTEPTELARVIATARRADRALEGAVAPAVRLRDFDGIEMDLAPDST